VARVGRVIPTPVGNTSWFSRSSRLSSVHPHARGEHSRSGGRLPAGVGSSPRPWGTRGASPECCEDLRFIPTPVGNTAFRAAYLCIPTVHPHACGEHCLRRRSNHLTGGSSPRLWGTL